MKPVDGCSLLDWSQCQCELVREAAFAYTFVCVYVRIYVYSSVWSEVLKCWTIVADTVDCLLKLWTLIYRFRHAVIISDFICILFKKNSHTHTHQPTYYLNWYSARRRASHNSSSRCCESTLMYRTCYVREMLHEFANKSI